MESEENENGCDISPPVAFGIDNADAANWLVRKIVEVRRYRLRVNEWAQREIRRSEREEQWLLDRYGIQLRTWLEAHLEEQGGRRRSCNLPGGVVGIRSEPVRLVTNDEAAAIRWCRENLADALQIRITLSGRSAPEIENAIRTVAPEVACATSIMKSVVNEHFAATGELPSGMNTSPQRDVLYIR